jgi:hypothetical protein
LIKSFCRIPVNLRQLKIQNDLYATLFVNLVTNRITDYLQGDVGRGEIAGQTLKSSLIRQFEMIAWQSTLSGASNKVLPLKI